MTRDDAIANAHRLFDRGDFLKVLRDRVAMETDSRAADPGPALVAYLEKQIVPDLAAMGFASGIVANPAAPAHPFLIAERIEDAGLPTVLIYGHGDTVPGDAANWRAGLGPLELTVEGDRLYGRGTADNKGQHTVNLMALKAVLAAREGRLGCNVRIILETGEEIGSPGLQAACRQHAGALKADVLIASDGPRLSAQRPTVFLGSRGALVFDLTVDLREGAHHSGNWGGLLRNPATVLAHAIATLVDDHGVILSPRLRPPPIPDAVRKALRDIAVTSGPDDPAIDPDWGEPGLTGEERVFGWNTLEVLAMAAGNPERPVGAIPPRAWARLQLRHVVGTRTDGLEADLQAHFDGLGLAWVKVRVDEKGSMAATRTDADDPWVRWACASVAATAGGRPALLPNLGGSIPNDAFAEVLGIPTLWVPHSHPGCAQHAPNEHMLAPVAREGLGIMAGLLWDLAENSPAVAGAQ